MEEEQEQSWTRMNLCCSHWCSTLLDYVCDSAGGDPSSKTTLMMALGARSAALQRSFPVRHDGRASSCHGPRVGSELLQGDKPSVAVVAGTARKTLSPLPVDYTAVILHDPKAKEDVFGSSVATVYGGHDRDCGG